MSTETKDLRSEIEMMLRFGNMSTFEIARVYEVSEEIVERILNEL